MMRISDVPHAPMLEGGANITCATATPEGPLVGVQFGGLGPLPMELRRWRRSWTQTIFRSASVPCHRRVNPPPQEDDDEAWLDRSGAKERVRRLKRVGRNLLLVIPEDMDRAILAWTLIVEGFRRFGEARNFVAALESLRAVLERLLKV